MGKNNNDRGKVLSDHKRVGKQFVPPARQLLNLKLDTNWINRMVPELVWMVPIHDRFGHATAVELCLALARAAQEIFEAAGEHGSFGFLTSYSRLSESQRCEVVEALAEQGVLSNIREALEPFLRLYPDCPLGFLGSPSQEGASDEDISWFAPMLEGFFDRRCQSSMMIQANVVYQAGVLGKLKYFNSVEPPDLEAIATDFDSDAGRKSAASVRATVNAWVGHLFEDLDDRWPRYFWKRNLDLVPNDEVNIKPDELHGFPDNEFWGWVGQFIEIAVGGLMERWRQLPKDLYAPEAAEVIGALLSRQVSIARRIARNPDIWDFHVGPVLLRTMVDAHISLAWLLKDPGERAKKFILYGLGQEKLHVEKLKQQQKETPSRVFKPMIKAKEEWINSQQYSFLTIVDVGAWSGASTRVMAEQAGLLSLYDHAYGPWSTCAHNMWNHVERFNTRYSKSPYLRHFRVPDDLEMEPQIDLLVNAAKYLQRSFEAVDDRFSLKIDAELPWDFLMRSLNELDPGDDHVKLSGK